MIKSYLSLPAIALAATFSFGAMADAATIVLNKNYGTNYGAEGLATTGGAGYVSYGANYARLADTGSGERFHQNFSLAGITNRIESLTLQITYADAGPGNGSSNFATSEYWEVYSATGKTPGGNPDTNAATRAILGKIVNTGTVSYTLTGSVLATAIEIGKVSFWFGEKSSNTFFGNQNFDLLSARLTVSAVPVPAAGLLLLGALGGLMALRRRKSTAALA